jgi:hypothetical protein
MRLLEHNVLDAVRPGHVISRWAHPLFGFGSESFPKELPKYLKRCHPPP